jgi:hypothetical protein
MANAKVVKAKVAKAKALRAKAAKRTTKPRDSAARGDDAAAGEFCTAVRDALARAAPDAVSDATLQAVLTAAVKIYAAKVERRGHDVAPFAPGAVTATETVVAACGMIRAADLNMFDVAIWFHRPPGIE